jgi:hypothetical protein
MQDDALYFEQRAVPEFLTMDKNGHHQMNSLKTIYPP